MNLAEILLGVVMISVALLVGSLAMYEQESQITAHCCCQGKTCTDTAYDPELNVCVLTLTRAEYPAIEDCKNLSVMNNLEEKK